MRIFSIFGLIIFMQTLGFSQTPLTVAENFNLKTPSGETVNLFNILDNDQYALIDFFSITCGPCQVFAPHIQISSEHFGNNTADVFFAGISYSGDNNQIVQWDSTYGITYPTISGSDGGGADVHINYGVLSVPTMVLIAPDKSIVGQLFLPDYIPSTNVIDSMLMDHGLLPVFTGANEIYSIQNLEVSIYPIPINDKATLELKVTFNSSLDIKLINLLGGIVYKKSEKPLQFGSYSMDLNFGHINPGIYILNINDNSILIHNQKVIIE